MLRAAYRWLAGLLLGAASRAARPKLDAEARLALTPRALDNELQLHVPTLALGEPKRVGHLLVYEGGLRARETSHLGPLGGPGPLATRDGAQRARRA